MSPPSPITRSSCKICASPVSHFGTTKVRKKYDANFLRCSNCGFIFIDEPHWLAEAYADPINDSDTGYVARNLECRERIQMFIELFLDPKGKYLDYAAGYGMFVRLMRDRGYDFRWMDMYCQNLFSRGFEEAMPLAGKFSGVTAFEVMEHLTDPQKTTAEIVPYTDCFIFTTTLLQPSGNPLQEWWYYALDHGQHVSFYTEESLRLLAARHDFKLSTDGIGFHAMSRNAISSRRFNRIRSKFWRRWTFLCHKRASLASSDYETIVRRKQ